MRIDILTVLPEMIESPLNCSILKRAQDKGLAEIVVHNLRDYTTNKHRKVDDYPFGGEAGMVMQLEPVARLRRGDFHLPRRRAIRPAHGQHPIPQRKPHHPLRSL